uniref:Uncharacterized protein n=1 Tax=Amphimedon queenslandica TaxID=400682 RepID=A0A1X7TL62_AMPQE
MVDKELKRVNDLIEEDEEYGDYDTSTDDEDNQVTKYREGLKEGVMSHPASLQLQCLMYIAGHIKIEPPRPYTIKESTGAVLYLPASCMALLPHFFRIRLLCLLPAVDVAKLEGTPVTAGISMDEIWEYIFNERLPLHYIKQIRKDGIPGINTVEELMSKGVECVSWKDAYFNAVFEISQYYCKDEYLQFFKCAACLHDHIIQDLFYGMGTFNSDPSSTDIYRCFKEGSTYSIHGVAHCTLGCPRLTPDRYTSMYPDPSDSILCAFYMSLLDVIKEMVDCNVSLKHLHISGHLFDRNDSLNLFDYLKKMLTSVEAITIHFHDKNEFIMKIYDVLFVQNTCSIKSVSLRDSEFEIVFPYLLQSCYLKQIELEVGLDDCNSYKVKAKMSSHFLYPPGRQPDQSISHSIMEILQHCQDLEKLSLHIDCCDIHAQLLYSQLTQCVADLLLRPTFKELVFSSSIQVSFDFLLLLLCNFFSSPYPVSMKLSFKCLDIPLYTDPVIVVNHEQEGNKSLDLANCFLSRNLSSLLPRNLVLGSLKISQCSYSAVCVLSSFASLDSITVKSLSVKRAHSTSGEISSSISSLLNIIHDTQHCDISYDDVTS